MTRLEIIQRFRDENPEFTANVLSTTTLNSLCLIGNKEICAKARLIVDDGSIDTITDESTYDLTALSKFMDIDEMPGGGITVVDSDGNEKRLKKTTKAELDANFPNWRTADSGRPVYYYRRGKNFITHPSPSSDMDSFNIDFVALSDDFNNDNIEPYNQLTYLEPFHPALIFYLIWRAKAKVGKPDEATSAMQMYGAYVDWMRRTVGGGKYGPIEFRPSGLPSGGMQK